MSRLRALCVERLVAAQQQGDDSNTYQDIRIHGQHLLGLELVLDEPTRIVVIAFCWDRIAMGRTNNDIKMFTTSLRILGVIKKVHLIVFHPLEQQGVELPWYTGMSYTAIPIDYPKELMAPPDTVRVKLDSILGYPKSSTDTKTGTHWRNFLSADYEKATQAILKNAKGLPLMNADMPRALRTLLDASASSNSRALKRAIQITFDRLWEGQGHEAPAPKD